MPEPSSDLARLLSLIAHELRTPLSVTSGYVKMLASERPGPLTEAQKHALGGAGRSCAHLTTVAADLSLLGRLERGEISPQPAAIDLEALAKGVVEGYVVHPDHPVTVSLTDGANAPLTLQADPEHLRRALGALLAAVVRAAPDDGAVKIGWKTLTASNGWSGVAGMDDGPRVLIGLALANRLDDLLKADASSLEPLDELQAGLGMALPVVRRLMGLEGGTIQSARESQSLGLRLTLPIVPPQKSATAPETAV
jgi:two-component system, chemotaxis family, CheB/CheR fusion protein